MIRKTFLPLLLLLAILLIALGVRLWGIKFGLPHLFARPDEQSLVRLSVDLFKGDLNPHFFEYPSAFIYLLYSVYSLFYWGGRLAGVFKDASDFWLLFFKDPSLFFLLPRYISVGSSLLTLVVLYRIGAKFYSRASGLVAAFWGALVFLMVREAHFGVTDTLLTFFCTLTVWRALGLYRWGRTRDFVFTAFTAGLAASTKYPGALLLFALIPAVGGRLTAEQKLKYLYKDARVWLLITVGLITFFAISPYIILDFLQFSKDFLFQLQAAKGSAVTDFGYWYHLSFTLRYGLGLPLLLLSLAGLVYWLARRQRQDLISLCYVLGYFLLMGQGRRPFVRYLLPIVPLLLLVAADTLVKISEYFRRSEKWRAGFIGIVACALIVPSALSIVRFDTLMSRKDTRGMAVEWLERNLAAGAVIANDGLYYNNLNLTEVPIQTQTRLDHFQPGFYAQKIGADFFKIFPRPAYEVYVVSDFYSSTLAVSAAQKSSPQTAQRIYKMLKELGVQYLVTSEYSYLPLYSDNWVRLKPALAGKTRLLKQFIPENPQSEVVPLFDPIDAFYVPYAGFAAIKNPGPAINIYQLF